MTQTNKKKKRKVTHTIDPVQYEIFRTHCQKERRSVSTVIESLLIYMNQKKTTSDRVIASI